MKRTISKMLGIAALAISGIAGSFIAATPAQAAYVQPYLPSGCTMVGSSADYPYRNSAFPTTTGWFVYCGSNATQFRNRAGDNLKKIWSTGTPTPTLRDRFKNANITLYVFTDSNSAALSQLFNGSVPADITAPSVGGFNRTVLTGNMTTPVVAVFEAPKNSSGTPVPYPNPITNTMFNYDNILAHETGHALDDLVGSTTLGSASAAYTFRLGADIQNFNLKNGCANTGPTSNMWGSQKTTICDSTTQQKRVGAPGFWSTKTNLRIVRESTGTTDYGWTKYFMDAPVNREIWAESIAIRRMPVNGGFGPAFVALDGWISYIYTCSKAYSDSMYLYITPLAASCP